jgi:hypothetical protein
VSARAVVSADPQTVAVVADDLRLEMIVETSELAASYARSAAEAAWRGDRLTLGVHLRQLRLATIACLKTFNELGAEGEKSGPRE